MRRTIVRVHLWLGLTIGLLWSLQGLTGALFVFSREMDRITAPSATPGPMASLDEIVAAAKRETKGAPISRLSVADEQHDLVNVLYTDAEGVPRAVMIDGASATAIGEREMEPMTPFTGSASRWLYVTHSQLNAGSKGETLIGISGLFLVTTVIGGLWIAWPKRRAWKQVFQVNRWRKLDARLYGWHRATGLLVGFALVILATTGCYLAFTDQVRSVMPRLLPFDSAQASMSMRHGHAAGLLETSISPQEALDVSLKRFPQATWVRVFMPNEHEPFYSIRLRQPGELRAWIGVTTVAIDAANGNVTYVYDPRTAPLANRVLDSLFSIHNGEVAWFPGRFLVMLAGFALPTLYVTGLLGWWRKRKRKADRSRTGIIDPVSLAG